MQKKVQMFPQSILPHNAAINVAAYCRVSTAQDWQAHSLEAQKTYYEKLIVSNPNWNNAGIYSDVGSGRNTKKRPGYRKMMARCRKGKIDLILTKSVSRFGRDFSGILHDLDELRTRNIDVWFEVGDMRLLASGSQVMLELYAVFAQAESEIKSDSIKWGLQQSFLAGDGKKSNLLCYGYVQDSEGVLRESPYESAVVRFIYQACADGSSLQKIVRLLELLGIRSPTGNATWASESIRNILSNEKYTGSVIHQKTYLDSGQRKRNRGYVDQYQIHDHHEGIVSKELFKRVAVERNARRRNPSNDM